MHIILQLTVVNGNAQLELDDDGNPKADEMVLTIQDTDADPFVSFTSSDGGAFLSLVTQTESADHTAYFYLTKLSENDITVGYSVSGTGTYQATNASGATGTPSYPDDHGLATSTIGISAYALSTSLSVPITSDGVDEWDEKFIITIVDDGTSLSVDPGSDAFSQ